MVNAISQHHDKSPKILIIRFSAIGDIALTTPVVRCLKKQLHAEIHYLTKSSFKTLLEDNPNIDVIWTLQKTIKETLNLLKGQKFDYILDLHKNLRSHLISLRLPGKRLTYNKTTWEKFLLLKFRINRLPALHVVDRYLEPAKRLGVQDDRNGLDFYINPSTTLPADVNQPFIACVIGATHFTKRLPVEKWIEVIHQRSEHFMLVGGPTDEQHAAEISNACGNKVTNFVGKLNLQQSALMIDKAQLVISNDTGFLHIAAALKKPIISLWGGTLKEYGFWPYYPKGINLDQPIEIEKLSCRPCSKFGRQDCPLGHFNCMQLIKAEDIAQAIDTSKS